MEYVNYEDFKKMDIRFGTVVEVKEVEDADKLLCFQLDFGETDENGDKKLRQIVSGLKEYYPNYQELIGRQLLYIVNLEPRKIKGYESNGMLMAVDGQDGKPVFIVPEKEVLPGSRVR